MYAAVLAALVSLAVGLASSIRLVSAMTRADPPHTASPDAIIALSSTLVGDSALDRIGRTRLATAISVALRIPGVPLVTTRIRSPAGTFSDGAQHRLIVGAGLESRWRVLEGTVRSTRDEAVTLRRELPGSDRVVVVVTSPVHTRRACATFESVGFRVVCVPARGGDERDRIRQLYEWTYEVAATWRYRRCGWIP